MSIKLLPSVALIFTSLMLNAADYSTSPAYFAFDVGEQGGVLLQTCPVQHEDFLLTKDSHVETTRALLDTPFRLHEICIDAILPSFEAATTCNEIISSISTCSTKDRETLFGSYVAEWKRVESAMKECHRACSLGFLQECNPGESHCALQRREDKTVCPKEAFLKNLEAHVDSSDAPLNPIFYASGDCFSELEILARLKRGGHRFGQIVFIDPAYESIISVLADVRKQGETTFGPSHLNPSLVPIQLKMVVQFIEILYFMEMMEPGVRIAFYANHKSFLADKEHALPSRLFVALDYQDEPDAHNPELEVEIDEISSSDMLLPQGLSAKASSRWSSTEGLHIVQEFRHK